MTTSSKTSIKLISKIARDFSQFKFVPGEQEHWSPKTNTITYDSGMKDKEHNFGLLHELAHALLGHNTYKSDFELLKLESLAWQKAAEIGQKYGVKIDDNHIQNCLDTYRDWLHRRSHCPTCGVHCLQHNTTTYICHNCGTRWHVSARRFARSYRRKVEN